MYVLDALEFHARMKPQDIAIIDAAGATTFRLLRDNVLGAALRVRALGLNPDLPVGIYVEDPLLHLVLMLALMHEAIPSISSGFPYEPAPSGVTLGACLADRTAPFMANAGATAVVVDNGWVAPVAPGTPIPGRRAFKSADSLVRITSSSGTTGMAKPVGFTADMVDRRIEFLAKIGSLGEQPSMTMMGFPSATGFRHLLGQLQLGHTQVLLSHRLDVAAAIQRFKVKFITASPAQLQGLLAHVEQQSIRLPSLKHIRIGGSSVSPVLMVRARMRLCPNLIGFYGATEIGVIAEAPAELLESIPGCAGFVYPWIQVEIVDDADRPLPAGAEGILRVRSKSNVVGYLGDHPENRTAFKDGWFYPGDLGALRHDRLLTITGRVNEIINAGGVKVSPNLINNVLTGIGGIVDAAAFGVDYPDRATEIWAAVVAPQPIDEKALIATCISVLNSRAPRRILRVEQIPRNANGKILAAELRRLAEGR